MSNVTWYSYKASRAEYSKKVVGVVCIYYSIQNVPGFILVIATNIKKN